MLAFLSSAILLGCCLYGLFLFECQKNWRQIPHLSVLPAATDFPFISILIAARNEETNLEACLNSVLQQKYPADRFEVILIDDHSEDQTPNIAQKFEAQNLHLYHLSDYLKGRKKFYFF